MSAAREVISECAPCFLPDVSIFAVRNPLVIFHGRLLRLPAGKEPYAS